jgi:UDPglucose 6-dehydrogenase
MPIVKAAREVNRKQRERVLDKLLGELKILKGRTIGILGLAFKPDTDDLRDAPSVDIARKLLERGAIVKAHDPVAMKRFREENPSLQVICTETAEEVAHEADAIILLTEWQQYMELDWKWVAANMRSPILVDGRNVLDRERMKQSGFRYVGLAG